MKIVIVGAAGAVGRTAVEALSGRHEIISVGRTSGRGGLPRSSHPARLEGTMAEGAGHARREITEEAETRQA